MALGAVFLILLIVYRSLLLPLVVLFTSVFALCAAILLVFGMAKAGWIQLNGQSQGILSILVIGAATDYALLYVARFREALTHTTNRTAAALTAWKASFEPILASGATVIIALLCLLFSDLNSNKALGPGRGRRHPLLPLRGADPAAGPAGAAWAGPRSGRSGPRLLPGDEREPELVTGLEGQKGLWRATGSLVSRRPRTVWMASVLLLLVAGRRHPATQGQRRGRKPTSSSPPPTPSTARTPWAGTSTPASGSPAVIVADEGKPAEVLDKTKASDGVGDAYLLADGGVPDHDRRPGARPAGHPCRLRRSGTARC